MTLLLILGLMIFLYFVPRLLGMGFCMTCRRGCAPWDVYCGRHKP